MHVLLPASIKRIRSKATEKRWRHHFPHDKLMGAFCCHGHQSFDPTYFKTLSSICPRLANWPQRYSSSKVGSLIQPEIKFVVFPIVSQWGLSVAMETRSNLPQNLVQPFSYPSDATHKIWSRLANWLQIYSSLKVWTTDGRTMTDHWYTLWAFCSGELKTNNQRTNGPVLCSPEPDAVYQVSTTEDFKRFLPSWPSWSCDHEHSKKFSCPQPMEAPNNIWLQLAQWFQTRRCWKCWRCMTMAYTTSSPMSFQLRWAKTGQNLPKLYICNLTRVLWSVTGYVLFLQISQIYGEVFSSCNYLVYSQHKLSFSRPGKKDKRSMNFFSERSKLIFIN